MTSGGAPGRVLVVDDEPKVRGILAAVLTAVLFGVLPAFRATRCL